MLYHPGENPTADLILYATTNERVHILFIRRAEHAAAEAGKWAFPGGFVDSGAKKNEKWLPDTEIPAAAARRELAEETGLYVPEKLISNMQFIGIFDSLERDPRNTPERWIAAHVFALQWNEALHLPVNGQDDASEARWFTQEEIEKSGKMTFAFDHFEIVEQFLASLRK